jgi:cupin superfamily acireductone dioxygenase involved in methionine salvage
MLSRIEQLIKKRYYKKNKELDLSKSKNNLDECVEDWI